MPWPPAAAAGEVGAGAGAGPAASLDFAAAKRPTAPLSDFYDGAPVYNASGRKLGGWAAASVRRSAYLAGLYAPDTGGGRYVAPSAAPGAPDLKALPGLAGGKGGGGKGGGKGGGAGKKAGGGAGGKKAGGAAKKGAAGKKAGATGGTGTGTGGVGGGLRGVAELLRAGGGGAQQLGSASVGTKAAAKAAAKAEPKGGGGDAKEKAEAAAAQAAAQGAMRALTSKSLDEYKRKLGATGWKDAGSPGAGFPSQEAAQAHAVALAKGKPGTMFAVIPVGGAFMVAQRDKAALLADKPGNVAGPDQGAASRQVDQQIAREEALQRDNLARDARQQAADRQAKGQGAATGAGGASRSAGDGGGDGGGDGAAVRPGDVESTGAAGQETSAILARYRVAMPDPSRLSAVGKAVILRRQGTIVRRAKGLAEAINKSNIDPESAQGRALRDKLTVIAAMAAAGTVDANAVSLNVAQEARQLLREAQQDARLKAGGTSTIDALLGASGYAPDTAADKVGNKATKLLQRFDMAERRGGPADALLAAYARGCARPLAEVGALGAALALGEALDWWDRGLVGPRGAALLAFADGRRDGRAALEPPPLDDDHEATAATLAEGLAEALLDLGDRLQAGEFDLDTFRDLAGGVLAEGVRAAYVAGLGGVPDAAEAAALLAALEEQSDYLAGFAEDILDRVGAALGLPEPEEDDDEAALAARRATTAARWAAALPGGGAAAATLLSALAGLSLAGRLKLYAGKAVEWLYRGLSARAARTDGGNYVVWWQNGVGHICRDCRDLADGSPYSLQQAPPPPASGFTACRANCRCSLRYQRVDPAQLAAVLGVGTGDEQDDGGMEPPDDGEVDE